MRVYKCDGCPIVAESEHDMDGRPHVVEVSRPAPGLIDASGRVSFVRPAIHMTAECGKWRLQGER